MKYVMVLADGETYLGLDGSRIVEVPDTAEPEDIETFLAYSGDDDPVAAWNRWNSDPCPFDNTGWKVVRTFGMTPREGDYS